MKIQYFLKEIPPAFYSGHIEDDKPKLDHKDKPSLFKWSWWRVQKDEKKLSELWRNQTKILWFPYKQ